MRCGYTRGPASEQPFRRKTLQFDGALKWNTLPLVRGLTEKKTMNLLYMTCQLLTPVTPLCRNTNMHQLSQVSFSLSFRWLHGSVLFGLAFIRQTGSAGFNGEPNVEGKSTKISPVSHQIRIWRTVQNNGNSYRWPVA